MGFTQEQVAERAGLTFNSISRYETGAAHPSQLALNMLAILYEKPVSWLLGVTDEPLDQESDRDNGHENTIASIGDKKGMIPNTATDRLELLASILATVARSQDVSLDYLIGLTDDPTPAAQLSAEASPSTRIIAESRVAHEDDNDDITARRPVEVLEVAGAGGVGTEVYDETPVGLLWFRDDWLKRHSIDPAGANIISVTGDSMEPTLPDGCSILVDKQRRTPQEGRIYVMRMEDGLVVKRLGKDEMGRWEIVSDNPDWDSVPMLYGTNIIGEVRWAARTF